MYVSHTWTHRNKDACSLENELWYFSSDASISFYRLCISFTLTVMCNLVWNSTCIGAPSPSNASSDRWKGQIVRLLTSCCVVKIAALRRISSCSPVTPVKDQSDLWLSMSLTQDNNGTSFTDLLWSRRSWEQLLPTIALNEHETAMILLVACYKFLVRKTTW